MRRIDRGAGEIDAEHIIAVLGEGAHLISRAATWNQHAPARSP